jgi:hypothetical protein
MATPAGTPPAGPGIGYVIAGAGVAVGGTQLGETAMGRLPVHGGARRVRVGEADAQRTVEGEPEALKTPKAPNMDL